MIEPTNPSGSIRFRTAGTSDIPLIQRLADEIWRGSYRELLGEAQVEYMLGWMYGTERLWNDLGSGVQYDIIENAGVPVGFIGYQRYVDQPVVHLHKLYLSPSQHGRGVGQAALRHVREFAKRSGATTVELRVNKRNERAIQAYRRAGFEIQDSIVADIGGGFVMDDYVMRASLAPASA